MRPIVHVVFAVVYAAVIVVGLSSIQSFSQVEIADVDMDAFDAGMVTLTYERDGREVTETLSSDRVFIDVAEEYVSVRVAYRPWWSLVLVVVTLLAAAGYVVWVVGCSRGGQASSVGCI